MDFTFIDLFGEKDIRFLISKSPRQLSDPISRAGRCQDPREVHKPSQSWVRLEKLWVIWSLPVYSVVTNQQQPLL